MLDANIIVVGGGCAGMQLIHSLLKLPLEQTGNIILIESNREITHKSWCFWSKNKTEYDFLISKYWTELKFGSVSSDLSKEIAPYRYNYINSEAFFDFHFQLISNSPRVKLVYEEVEKIQSVNGIKRVFTRNNEYQAQHVYNSALDFTTIDSERILLWQHFKGWFIKTDQATFKPSQATMMDFNIPQEKASHFMYVLPFSETEALIEFTAFSIPSGYSDENYDSFIKNYIDEKFNCSYTILREEKGKIPMTDFKFPATSKEGVIHIGSLAGSIKPSTGYAFNRISRHTAYLLESFLDNNKSIYKKQGLARFHFYDTLLLQIIKDQPEQVAMIMNKLFTKNSFYKILSFLDERTSILQEISLFYTLPKRLFLKEVLKYVWFKFQK
ncbi:MAG: hypothetical protein FJY21_00985 [Bacteroidetes bacterium]|nr:hypothetical protein [Bacteroidota bacterium]